MVNLYNFMDGMDGFAGVWRCSASGPWGCWVGGATIWDLRWPTVLWLRRRPIPAIQLPAGTDFSRGSRRGRPGPAGGNPISHREPARFVPVMGGLAGILALHRGRYLDPATPPGTRRARLETTPFPSLSMSGADGLEPPQGRPPVLSAHGGLRSHCRGSTGHGGARSMVPAQRLGGHLSRDRYQDPFS